MVTKPLFNQTDIMATVSRNIQPYKCSLRFYPPTLIVFYDDLGAKKRRRRSIPLREFNSSSNISNYATSHLYSCERHKDFVAKIKRKQIESLLGRIQVAMQNDPKSSTPKKPTVEPASSSGTRHTTAPLQDLNKTMDTSLTNLSGLPSLKPITSGSGTAISNGKASKSAAALSFDIDEILKQSDAGLLADEEDLETAISHQDLKLGANSKDKQDDFLSLLLSTPTHSSSNAAPGLDANKLSNKKANTEKPQVHNTVSGSSALPTLSSLLPATSTSSTNTAMKLGNDADGQDSYEDDFEQDIPKHKDDDYTLSDENLSGLSEEIESSEDDDDLNIGRQKLILQTSDLLQNEDDIVTPSGSDNDSSLEDYNKLSETDYNKRKAAMEIDFKKKQIKPGDPGFIYDKDVKFDPPKMESGWDDKDSSDSEF